MDALISQTALWTAHYELEHCLLREYSQIHALFYHNSGFLFLSHYLSLVRTSSDCWLTAWPNSTHSTLTTPLISKKIISIDFNFDLLILAFFLFADMKIFQCIDCLFVYSLHWKFTSRHMMIFLSKLHTSASHCMKLV